MTTAVNFDRTAVTHHKGGGMTLEGDAITLMQGVQLRGFISLYKKTKMIPTRGITISKMLILAQALMKKKEKYRNNPAGWEQAIQDLDVWIKTMQAAIPHVESES